jgi:hypothetical protein
MHEMWFGGVFDFWRCFSDKSLKRAVFVLMAFFSFLCA